MNTLDQMPPHSRVWIYQANRELTSYEVITARQRLQSFVDEWSAHQVAVKGYGEVYHNRFLVLIADDKMTNVSGCSIDSSVKVIKGLAESFDVDFFDRLHIAYKDGDKVLSTDKNAFQQLIDDGKVDENTIVFNNLVDRKADFESNWEVPLKDSWHATFFKLATV